MNDQQDDICGLLLRNLAETFVVSVIVLYEGDAAPQLAGDHARHVRILNEENDLKVDELIENWPANDRFNLEQGTREAGKLLHAHGESEDDLRSLYSMLYRSESTFGGHGLGIVTPYVAAAELPMTLRTRPGPITAKPRGTHLLLAALYTLILGRHVLRDFVVSTDRLETIGEALLAWRDAEVPTQDD